MGINKKELEEIIDRRIESSKVYSVDYSTNKNSIEMFQLIRDYIAMVAEKIGYDLVYTNGEQISLRPIKKSKK